MGTYDIYSLNIDSNKNIYTYMYIKSVCKALYYIINIIRRRI